MPCRRNWPCSAAGQLGWPDAAAQGFVVDWVTGLLNATGSENERTDWYTHVWHALHLVPGGSLTISLLGIGREGPSFWPDYSVQFQRIRLTLNQSYEDDMASAATAYNNWLNGVWSDPTPPPPPPGGGEEEPGHGYPYRGIYG